MLIKNLIALLSTYDPDLQVMVDGYESGLDEPNIRSSSYSQDLKDNHPSYEGRYVSRPFTSDTDTDCIVIGR